MNKIKISGLHYNQLKKHLFPGDHCEAVAIALCGRSQHENNHTLLVQDLLLVPYETCFARKPDQVSWPTEVINPFLERAAKKGLAILKIHCHPGYYEQFSETDDRSDQQLFRCIQAWLADDQPHASCIMLPDGRIFGRFFAGDMSISLVNQISVAGSTLFNWHYDSDKEYNEALQMRNLQAFGKKTIQMLANMKIGVVGCSGTGSIVIEQLKRFGIGTLVQVDPDFVDFLNLNRIINSLEEDAKNKVMKTVVSERAIRDTGFKTNVISFQTHVTSREVVKELGECDLLFSCVDGHEGRHVLSLISSFYLIALIDMGVKLEAEPGGGIRGIFGSVHFIQPGGSSLLNRGQYDLVKLRGEAIRRANKEEAQRNQYLAAADESSAAVISVNMQVAAIAVNELLARLHLYRNISNEEIDIVRVNFNDCATYHESFSEPCSFFKRYVGRGDIEPLLDNPELSRHE